MGLQKLLCMDPCGADPCAALEETRDTVWGAWLPQSHLSPLFCSQGMGAAWQGAGGLRLPTGAGEGLLWLTRREEPAFSILLHLVTWALVEVHMQSQEVWIGPGVLHFGQPARSCHYPSTWVFNLVIC